MDQLEESHLVTKVLGGDGLTINDAELFFDIVITNHSETGTRLSRTAVIVHSPNFDSAIANIQERRKDEL